MVEGKYSATGHPLLVGGPQVGYFYPGLTYEIDMHAPGLDWRGATSAPFPGYMLIGRGADFATTLTSAGADDTDEFAETLCGGRKTGTLQRQVPLDEAVRCRHDHDLGQEDVRGQRSGRRSTAR